MAAVMLFSLGSCSKEHFEKRNAETGLQLLLGDNNIKNMIDQIPKLNIFVNNDGVLVFGDAEDFVNTLTILENCWYSTDSTLNDDAALDAFELFLGFTSLHRVIEDETMFLERKGCLTPENDPDNHYIVSDFLRTLLTPNCEVIVDDVLYFLFEEYAVGISEPFSLTRQRLISILNNKDCSDEDIFFFCLSTPNAYLITGDDQDSVVDFNFKRLGNGKIKFENRTNCFNPGDIVWQWDFGDGTISNEKNPIHNFNSDKEFNVTLTAISNGIPKSKTRQVGAYCQAYFTHTQASDGSVFFSSLSVIAPGDAIVKYTWNFGDSVFDEESQSHKIKHSFPSSGVYRVRLSILTQDGCTATYEDDVLVESGNICHANASKSSGGSKHPHVNIGNGNFLKTSVQTVNLPFVHMASSKVVCKMRNPNGTYSNVEAKKIKSGLFGNIYRGGVSMSDCGNQEQLNIMSSNFAENKKKAVFDLKYCWADECKFKVGKNSLYASYSVQTVDTTVSGTGVSIHNRNF